MCTVSAFNVLMFGNITFDTYGASNTNLSNTLMSSKIIKPSTTVMKSHAVFPKDSVKSRLRIYMTSALGQPIALLGEHFGAEEENVGEIKICFPAGEYFVLFVASADNNSVGVGEVYFSDQSCDVSNIRKYGEYILH